MTASVTPMHARARPTPQWHPSMQVVRHDDATETVGNRRVLLTVQMPVSLGLYRDLMAAVRRHHPDVVIDGRGDHEAVLVAVDAQEDDL